MNQNAIIQGAAVLIALIGAMFSMIFVLDAPGNNLSRAFYIGIGIAFLLALLNPKLGMVLLVLSAATLDLMKRFLILYGNVGLLDLMTVLGTAPIIFLGVCLSIMIYRIIGGETFRGREWTVFFLIFIISAGVILLEIRTTGSLLRGGAYGASAGAFIPLLLFAGVLFPRREDQINFLKFFGVVFLGVALYGIYQGIYGYNSLELAYLKSGLTISIHNLADRINRPFSTLNSTHTFGVMMACWTGVAIGLWSFSKKHRVVWLIGAIIFGLATFASYNRTAWVLAVALLVALYAFRSKVLTLAIYGGGVVAFLVIAFWGFEIIKILQHQVNQLNLASDYARRAFTVGTFYDRVATIQYWATNPEAWTWFGKAGAGGGSHDAIGQILHKYGAVGLFVVTTLGGSFLFYCHMSLFRIKDKQDRNLAAMYLAVVFAVMATGMMSGGHVAIFPVNLFFWLIMGFLMKFFILYEKEPAPEPAKSSSQSLVLRPATLTPSSAYFSR
jgi:hypothetical protein